MNNLKNDTQKDKRTMEEEIDNLISPMVKVELTKVKKRVLGKDRDFVAVVDGEEGSGKSVLVMQICKFLDPTFNLDRVVFNADDFLKLIKNPDLPKGSAIVLDEAFSSINNRASLSEVNRAMIGVATEMRQKNLFVFLCIPSFFDLDRYFALWRCRALFHVYFTPEEDRRYIIFPKEEKKNLYLLGKKTYSYRRPHSPFPPFNFPNYYVVDETEYRLKKSEAFKKRTVSHRARIWLTQRNAYIKYIISVMGITQEEVSNIPALYGSVPLTHQNMSLIMKEIDKEEE